MASFSSSTPFQSRILHQYEVAGTKVVVTDLVLEAILKFFVRHKPQCVNRFLYVVNIL